MKKRLYEQLARVGKALSSPARLELLDLLSQGPCTVENLARKAGLSVGNASQHLRVLSQARLVESEKRGLYVTYRLADAEVGAFFVALRSLGARRLAEIERILNEFKASPESLEAVDARALAKRVQAGEVALLDVRPEDEYRAAHIPGALSVPLERLKSSLGKLPRDREIVAYCRGPYCVLALEAVELLRRRGFRAARLDDGVLEWRARGGKLASAQAAAAAR